MKYFLLIILMIFYFSSNSQNSNDPYFFIEDNKVIFQFTLENWNKRQNDKSSLIYDFKNFEVPEIIKSSSDKEWKKDGWTLHKVNQKEWQLRKNLDEFHGDFNPQFKYLIKKDNWTKPISEPIIPNNGVSKKPIYTIDESGNATFKLKGEFKASTVILSGSFNKWDEKGLKMKKTAEGWSLTLHLEKGIYEYKFIVDGKWTHDVTNPITLVNEHQTLNSILVIGDQYRFFLKGNQKAKKVILSGSFNNWDEQNVKMKKVSGGWEINTPIPPGKHFYKFVVDGKWILDPNNYLTQRDKKGNENSVLIIRK